jgi:chloride channel 3/4/5
MSTAAHNNPYASSSSSNSHSPPAADTPISADDDRDELDLLDNDDGHHGDVLNDDPIQGSAHSLGAPLSFKRRQQQDSSLLSAPSRFLSAWTGLRSPRGATNHSRSVSRGSISSLDFRNPSSSPLPESSTLNVGSKDGVPLDWYMEGPGRRVAYEDLTAIDWIFEYTKERQRLRVLGSNSGSLMAYIQHVLDASQVWLVLLMTGMLVGAVAAWIDVTTDWLGDLKLGFCSSGPEGGHFYLNKSFCCLGYDQGSKCTGWKSWGEALGVHSTGGKWFLEYFFFISFSVCSQINTRNAPCSQNYRWSWPTSQHCLFRYTPYMLSIAVSPRSRPFWGGSSFGGSWGHGP